MRRIKLLGGVGLGVAALMAFCPPAARAATIIPGLLGGDLTDPDNNGDDSTPAGANFNATFAASTEASFDTDEAAFNVFDNKLGPNEAKYCCGTNFPADPFNVDATLGDQYVLTTFTLTSSNDSPERDPRVFKIQGANSPSGPFTDIYSRTDAGSTPFTNRDETLRFDAGTDFTLPAGFSTFRLLVTGSGDTGATSLALGEIEYFGNVVPEPASLGLIGLGGLGLLARRRQIA